MLKYLKKIWFFFKIKKKEEEVYYSTTFISDIPEILENYIVYISSNKDNYWVATLLCPCGCNEVIKLNLLRDASPRWSFKIKQKKISLYPSIWRTKGCRSHFSIIDSKLRWFD